jgi:tetratricopeptide (TPR) repeat protein
MAEDDFMLAPEEARLGRRKRRRIVLITLGVLLLIAAGVFGARPAAGAIKAWQARRHAQRAFAYIEKEKWMDAHGEAVAAYQLRPTEPQALRAVARFLSRTHQPEALDFWKQLAEKTSLTRQDVRDEAMIAIIASDTARADAAMGELLDSRAEPADWLLAAKLSFQKNLREEAKPYLDKIVTDPRTTESEQFRATLLQLALAGDDQTKRADALTRLKKVVAAKTATSLDALVVLAQNVLSGAANPKPMAGDSAAAAEAALAKEATAATTEGSMGASDLSRALESHPLGKAQHKLLALDLRMHVDPTQREALISRAIADWKGADPSGLASLGAWLNSKGEYQREIDTIPLEKALQSRDLFLQHLDALGALGRWNEIKQLLGSERFPLDPVVQTMYLARCSVQLGEKTAARNNWQRALEAAADNPGKLMTLADYAEKNGNADIAEAAYHGTAAMSPKLRVAQDGRLRIAQASHDTKKLHAILAEMLALWPNDPAIQNDEAYTRLLLLPVAGGEEQIDEINAIEQLANKLVQQNPASLPHRTLLALARLKQHRPFAALEVYSNIQIVPNAVSPSALAVHAAVLAANGRRDDARHEIEQAPLDQLLPEEQAGTADLR